MEGCTFPDALFVDEYEGDLFYSCYRQALDHVRKFGFAGASGIDRSFGDKHLVVLLSLAGAPVLRSFCEGFGLPAVASAACGMPVVATTWSPLPGLLGEEAIGVEPNDRAGWRSAIAQVLSDVELPDGRRAAVLAVASWLSWQNSARQLLSIIEGVVETRVAAA